jgi:diketogulonate reductase-like aldo/keto reductase
METERFPAVGLGTGGAEYLSGEECVDVVSTALEMGYRHVDTAVMYENQRWVGRGIEAADVPREEVLLATKVPPDRLAYDDVLACIDECRDELGVERIDVGYVHFPTQTYDPERTLAAFADLADGALGAVGVSNFDVDQLERAQAVTGVPVVANQVEMHPLCRQSALVEAVAGTDVTLVAYAPLARGRVFEVEPVVEVAEKHGVSPAAVSLAWLTDRPNVVAVAKSTNPAHLRANLEAASLSLDPDDVRRIEAIDRTERLVDVAAYE